MTSCRYYSSGTAPEPGPSPRPFPPGWQTSDAYQYVLIFLECAGARIGAVDGEARIVMEFLRSGKPAGCDTSTDTVLLTHVWTTDPALAQAFGSHGIDASVADVARVQAGGEVSWEWGVNDTSSVAFQVRAHPGPSGPDDGLFFWLNGTDLVGVRLVFDYPPRTHHALPVQTASLGRETLHPGDGPLLGDYMTDDAIVAGQFFADEAAECSA